MTHLCISMLASLLLLIFDSGLQLKHSLEIVLLSLIIYSIFLSPIIWNKAYLHGHIGSYTMNSCNSKCRALTRLILAYSLDNDGILPKQTESSEVISLTEKYTDMHSYFEAGEKCHDCPLRWLFTAQHGGIHWNSQLSGITIKELIELDSIPQIIHM